MTNAIKSILTNPAMEFIPCEEKICLNSDFVGFDDLLSKLLDNSSADKGMDDITKEKLSAFYGGLFGGVIPFTQDTLTIHNQEAHDLVTMQNQEGQEVVNKQLLNFEENIFQVDSKQLKAEPGTDQKEFSVEALSVSNNFENNKVKIANILNDTNEIKEIVKETVKEINDELNKQVSKEVIANISKTEDSVPTSEKIVSEIALKPFSFEKVIIPKKFKGIMEVDTKSENIEIKTVEVLNENTDTKVVSKKQFNDVSLESDEKNNDFQLDKRDSIVSQTFEFNVFEKNESITANHTNALAGKAEILTNEVKNHIVESSTFAEIDGKQEFEIKLNPDFLGKIVIRMERSADGMYVKITTSNPNVKEILSGQSIQMQDAIKAQGVELKNVEIVYTGMSNNNRESPNNGKYKIPNKSSISKIKEEFEQAIIGGATGSTTILPDNYNGSVNYLV